MIWPVPAGSSSPWGAARHVPTCRDSSATIGPSRTPRASRSTACARFGTRSAGASSVSSKPKAGRERPDPWRSPHASRPRTTRARTAEDVARWFDGVHPAVVAEEGGRIVGFASTSSYRPRECYAKIAEFSVYVARDHRGRGAGRRALEALIEESRSAGLHKLVSRIFPENISSRAACRSVGFREVGTYEAHGELEGVWKDC